MIVLWTHHPVEEHRQGNFEIEGFFESTGYPSKGSIANRPQLEYVLWLEVQC